MKEHSIKIEKTAYYYSIGELNNETNEIWIACHGYGQLAKYFIKKLGVSIYNVDELNKVLDYKRPDVIQVPINIFDNYVLKNYKSQQYIIRI